VQTSASQGIITVLCDNDQKLLVELMKTGATINSEGYVQTTNKLKQLTLSKLYTTTLLPANRKCYHVNIEIQIEVPFKHYIWKLIIIRKPYTQKKTQTS